MPKTRGHSPHRLLVASGWVLFGAMFLPAFTGEMHSIPAVVFWFLPLTLPFWFGMFAALAAARIRRDGRASGWAVFHTLITVLGAILLALWTTVVWDNGDDFPVLARWGGAIAYLALLPAALKLFSNRRPQWRLYRALTLNALGCLIFAGQFVLGLGGGDGSMLEIPGPSVWLAVPALMCIAVVARRLELATRARDGVPSELPTARIATG